MDKTIFSFLLILLMLFQTVKENKCEDLFGDVEATIAKFTYGNDDLKGPKYWHTLRFNTDNDSQSRGTPISYCTEPKTWRTPGNIVTSKVVATYDLESEAEQSSLEINIIAGIENLNWEFGYPWNDYHGIEIRPIHMGTFQVADTFDPRRLSFGNGTSRKISDENTMYEFAFASLFYCEPTTPGRSMYTLDGEKFPLEIDMIFFKDKPSLGIDATMETNQAILVAIIGELSEHDNPRLEPVIKAAKIYNGTSYDVNESMKKYQVNIRGNFSASWLLPDSSSYYYFDNSNFPVPPCWPIQRTYLLKNRIKISKRQLNILTNITSRREASGKLSCTFSVSKSNDLIRDQIRIRYNPHPYRYRGWDNRPKEFQNGDIRDEGSQLGIYNFHELLPHLLPLIAMLFFRIYYHE